MSKKLSEIEILEILLFVRGINRHSTAFCDMESIARDSVKIHGLTGNQAFKQVLVKYRHLFDDASLEEYPND